MRLKLVWVASMLMLVGCASAPAPVVPTGAMGDHLTPTPRAATATIVATTPPTAPRPTVAPLATGSTTPSFAPPATTEPATVVPSATIAPTPKPTVRPTLKPTARPAPTTATSSGRRIGAVCRDGTRSTATGRGACSHHGGVDHWLYG